MCRCLDDFRWRMRGWSQEKLLHHIRCFTESGASERTATVFSSPIVTIIFLYKLSQSLTASRRRPAACYNISLLTITCVSVSAFLSPWPRVCRCAADYQAHPGRQAYGENASGSTSGPYNSAIIRILQTLSQLRQLLRSHCYSNIHQTIQMCKIPPVFGSSPRTSNSYRSL